MLGLGTSRNVSDVSNALLQQHYDGTVFSILLFVFSAIKGPAKELRLSFMLSEKYVNKIFQLFSGSESAEVSPILMFKSCELSVEMTPAETFSSLTPLLPEFPWSLTPYPKNFQGGVDFFWNNPLTLFGACLKKVISDPSILKYRVVEMEFSSNRQLS